MVVLIISSQYPPEVGGGGAHVFYLANGLASLENASGRHKCEVHVLTASTPVRRVLERRRPNLWVHRVSFDPCGSVILQRAVEYGLELCRTLKPEIVHAHHFEGCHVGQHLKAAFGMPLIVTFHKTPYGGCVSDLAQRDARYSAISFACSSVDALVAGSRAFQNELSSLGAHDVRLIYMGVDYDWLNGSASTGNWRGLLATEAFESVLRGQTQLVLCPARLDSRKDLETFVRAAGYVKRNLVSHIPLFIITGNDPKSRDEERYKKELLSIGRSQSVSENLLFANFDTESMPAVFRLASACVLPSVREGLGLVLLEALALGTPVVAVAGAPGVDEVITQDEVNGLLFSPRDADDLGRQLTRILLDEQPLVETLTRNGRRLVRAHFDHLRMAKAHYQLYRKLTLK
jgi:glycosyltransferase involved in cell wall biosynthesis